MLFIIMYFLFIRKVAIFVNLCFSAQTNIRIYTDVDLKICTPMPFSNNFHLLWDDRCHSENTAIINLSEFFIIVTKML